MASKDDLWKTLHGLRRLITSKKFQNLQVGVFPKQPVVSTLMKCLEDGCEDALCECLQLLSAAIPHLESEVDILLSDALPQITAYLGNEDPQIKLSAMNFFYTYLKHTGNIQRFIEKFLEYAMQNEVEKIRYGGILCINTFLQYFLKEKNYQLWLHALVHQFSTASPQVLYTAFYALKRINKIVGDEEFYNCLKEGERNAYKLYKDILNGKRLSSRMFPMGYSILEACLQQNVSLDDEIKRYEKLHSIRSQIRSVGWDLVDLLPHIEYLVVFLGKLLLDTSLKVQILSLDILGVIIERANCEVVMHLEIFIQSLLKSLSCYERRIRRQCISLIHRIMHYVHPMVVMQQLLESIHSNNCSVRSEIINRVTAGLFYYSFYSFDFNLLCSMITPFLEDSILQVQQTVVECLITIGYVWSLKGCSLDYFANFLKQTCHARKSSVNVIISRVRKGLLPSCTSEGLVLHAKFQHPDTDSTVGNASDDSCLSKPNSELFSKPREKSIFTISNDFTTQKSKENSTKETAGRQLKCIDGQMFKKTERVCNDVWPSIPSKTASVSQEELTPISLSQEELKDFSECHDIQKHPVHSATPVLKDVTQENTCDESGGITYFHESPNGGSIHNTTAAVSEEFMEDTVIAEHLNTQKHNPESESQISEENVSSSTLENSQLSYDDFIKLENEASLVTAEKELSPRVQYSTYSVTDSVMCKTAASSICDDTFESEISYVTSREDDIAFDEVVPSDTAQNGSGDAQDMDRLCFSTSRYSEMQKYKLSCDLTGSTENRNSGMVARKKVVNCPRAEDEGLPPHFKNFNIILVDEHVNNCCNIEEVSDSDEHSNAIIHVSFPASETELDDGKKLFCSNNVCEILQETDHNVTVAESSIPETCKALTLFKFPVIRKESDKLLMNLENSSKLDKQTKYCHKTCNNAEAVGSEIEPLLRVQSSEVPKLLDKLESSEKESKLYINLEEECDRQFIPCPKENAVSEREQNHSMTYTLGEKKHQLVKKLKVYNKHKGKAKQNKNCCVNEQKGQSELYRQEEKPISSGPSEILSSEETEKDCDETPVQTSKQMSPVIKMSLIFNRNDTETENKLRQPKACNRHQYKYKKHKRVKYSYNQFVMSNPRIFQIWLRKNFHFSSNSVSNESMGKDKVNMKKNVALVTDSKGVASIPCSPQSPKVIENVFHCDKQCCQAIGKEEVSKNMNAASKVKHVQGRPSTLKSKPPHTSKVKKKECVDNREILCENEEIIDTSDQLCSLKLVSERRASDQWSSNIEFPRRSLSCPWADSFEEKVKELPPFDGVDQANQFLKQACENITENDIAKKEEYMLSVVRLAKFHPVLFGEYQLNKILLNMLTEMKNLRPSIAGQAVLTIGYLYMLIKKPLESKLRVVLAALLSKSGNRTFAGSYNAVIRSIFYVLKSVPLQKAAIALIQEGGRHPNKAVRETAAQFLSLLAEKLGPNRCLSPNICNFMLNTAAQFILDGSPLTRHCGKLMFSVFVKNKNFDALKGKHISESVQMSISKILQTVSSKGVEKEMLPINVIWTEEL